MKSFQRAGSAIERYASRVIPENSICFNSKFDPNPINEIALTRNLTRTLKYSLNPNPKWKTFNPYLIQF